MQDQDALRQAMLAAITGAISDEISNGESVLNACARMVVGMRWDYHMSSRDGRLTINLSPQASSTFGEVDSDWLEFDLDFGSLFITTDEPAKVRAALLSKIESDYAAAIGAPPPDSQDSA